MVWVIVAVGLAVLLWVALQKLKGGSPSDELDPQISDRPGKRCAPPDGLAVARRACCLACLIGRGQFEHTIAESRKGVEGAADAVMNEFKPACRDMNGWLKEESLWPYLSRIEESSLQKKPGDWSEQEIVDAAWRIEAFGILQWALGLRDLPEYDVQVEAVVPEVLDRLKPIPDHPLRTRLRPVVEIESARDRAELWLWRARTSVLRKDPENNSKLPPGFTFEKIISMTVEKAEKDGLFQSIQSDFPAFGKSYASLNDEELSLMTSIATERLHALNWLCGYGDDWDNIRRET